MSESEDLLKRHSHHHHTCYSNRDNITPNSWKSDMNVSIPSDVPSEYSDKRAYDIRNLLVDSVKKGGGEYYKRYEHDVLPVKDNGDFLDTNTCSSENIGDRPETPLTNSHLDILEMQIMKEFPETVREVSRSSLESNIKLFKTTVEEIFENFFTSMQDYERYKVKYQEILAKSEENVVIEMEDFIKDMIQHILLTDTSSGQINIKTNPKRDSSFNNLKESDIDDYNEKIHNNLRCIVEACKNDVYSSISEHTYTKEICNERFDEKYDMLNIIMLNVHPNNSTMQLNQRNLFSEVNISQRTKNGVLLLSSRGASAENLEKVADKKRALEKHEAQELAYVSERDIPVKVSCARKNIHAEDERPVDDEKEKDEKSFLSKICNYFCKKCRR